MVQTHNEKPNNYLLKTDELGRENLKKQHLMLEKDSLKHVKRAGLTSGQIVWDIGCGSGEMTSLLATIVGPTGHVFALDVSKEQLNTTQRRTQAEGLSNITFVHTDLSLLENYPLADADMVYARLLFMHLPDPRTILNKIASLLKTGGVLCIEESILGTLTISPAHKDIAHFVKTLVALGKERGSDYNIGLSLPNLIGDAGFSPIEANLRPFRFDFQEGIALMLNRIEEIKDKVVKTNLATLDQISTWRTTFEQILENNLLINGTIEQQMMYILAWKI